MRHSVRFHFLRLLSSSSIAAFTAAQAGGRDGVRGGSGRSTITTLAGVGLGFVSYLVLLNVLPNVIARAAAATPTASATVSAGDRHAQRHSQRLAQAEPNAEICAPPVPGEFLLLVVANSEEEQTQALDRVGNELEATVCQYLADTVVRISGLPDQDAATELARSLTNDIGLSAFITQLPEETPEPEFAPRPYGEALNLPEVQVVEARPAMGEMGSGSVGEAATETTDSTDPPETDETTGNTVSETTENPAELPTFSPEDLPPANLTAEATTAEGTPDAATATEAIDTPPRDVVEAKQPATAETIATARVPFPGTVNTTEAGETIAQASGYSVPPPPGFTPEVDPTADGKITINGQFSPQPIAAGYVVLVDYFNDPAIAAQVASLTGQAVGLVSYGQRPFLMADFSTSETEANATLEKLTEQGLWVMVVDSSRAILLTPRVVVD